MNAKLPVVLDEKSSIIRDAEGCYVAQVPSGYPNWREDAEQLVRMMNSHDALVEALSALLRPLAPEEIEECPVYAEAAKALAAATGSAKSKRRAR